MRVMDGDVIALSLFNMCKKVFNSKVLHGAYITKKVPTHAYAVWGIH